MPLKLSHILASLAVLIALPACTQAAAKVILPDGDTIASEAKSLSAARYEEPVCFAYTNSRYDGVVSLHKDKSGRIQGESFGVKSAKNSGELRPFQQSFEGKYKSNVTIDLDIKTEFENSRRSRTELVKITPRTLQLNKMTMEQGDCTDLVNSFLKRDIERRRKAEEAAKRIF